MVMDQVLLSTGSVTGGASVLSTGLVDGDGSKCFCLLDLGVVDQVLLSTGPVVCGSSVIVNWSCG